MISLIAIRNSRDLQPVIYESLLDFASEDRKQRAKKFFRREDACRSVISEALAKYCVAKEAGISPGMVSFHIDSFGKPHTDRGKEVHFSVSHSGTWVVCSAGGGPVGTDVEYVRHRDLEIAKRFYHPNEYAALIALPEHERTGRFFDLWTIKESYIKALGKGLSCPLNSFEIMFENDGIRMKSFSGNPIMHFKQYDLGAEYRCAVCARNEEFAEEINVMTPDELLNDVVPSA